MIWNIIADSSCEIMEMPVSSPMIRFSTVPFIITVDHKDYVDDENLNKYEMLDAMEHSKEASHTSCPSPAVWLDEIAHEGPTIILTISKNLSGSYNSAATAIDMYLEKEQKPIHIIDSLTAGPGTVMLIMELKKHIEAGLSFEETVQRVEKYRDEYKTSFALCSFNNLVKNGRMNAFAGFVATKLGFWGLGIASNEGTIIMKGKTRGQKKIINLILEDMAERCDPKQKVVISHCDNPAAAEALRDGVLARWPHVAVEMYETRGLCSYYAERHGLILSFI